MALTRRNNLNNISITAATLGVALNMVVWIFAAALLSFNNNSTIKPPPKAAAQKQIKQDKIRPGKDNSTAASISWISYDAFKDLLAKNNKTNQAALQNKVKPIKKAPVHIKKLSKTKINKQKANNTAPPPPPPPSLSKQVKHLAEPKSNVKDNSKKIDKDNSKKLLALQPKSQVGEQYAKKSSKNNLKNEPSKALDSKPKKPNHKKTLAIEKNIKKWLNSRINNLLQTITTNNNVAKKSNPSGSKTNKGKLTSVPKSHSQSPPASFVKADHKIRLGKVVAGPGIEIRTVVPDFSAVTRASSVPRAMKVKLTFDKSGEVTSATITRSSTYPNFDSAVLTSLYRWRAVGKRMKKINTSFTMHFTLLW